MCLRNREKLAVQIASGGNDVKGDLSAHIDKRPVHRLPPNGLAENGQIVGHLSTAAEQVAGLVLQAKVLNPAVSVGMDPFVAAADLDLEATRLAAVAIGLDRGV